MRIVSIIFVLSLLIALNSNSYAQIKWTKYPDPVLDPGPSGSWDDGFLAFSKVIYKDNIYRMWYAGARGQTFNSIGYATSSNGITWTKYNDPATTNTLYAESDPVLIAGQEGEWDDAVVSCPYVLFLDSMYHMWYGGSTDPSLHLASIGHAISTDGINWQKDTLNNPVLSKGLDGTWDDTWVFGPFVLYIDGTFHMWYNAWNGTAHQIRIGHATSPDGISWDRDPNNPVLSFGYSQDWDYPRVDGPSIIFDGNFYQMWYSGGNFFSWKIGYAYSQDGSEWTKYDGNPVLSGTPGNWDSKWVGLSSVLDSANYMYKMWYSGGDADWDGHIGYAELVTGIKILNENLPKGYVLDQNYPNPFNPSTNIGFSIPKSEFITLKVYNILGEEVATLVSEKLTAGKYKYDWKASGLASGVYYYQLVAGNYRELKKMILLR